MEFFRENFFENIIWSLSDRKEGDLDGGPRVVKHGGQEGGQARSRVNRKQLPGLGMWRVKKRGEKKGGRWQSWETGWCKKNQTENWQERGRRG